MKIKEERVKKFIASLANTTLFLSIFSVMSLVLIMWTAPTVNAAVIVVPEDYPTIQQAIENANPGDTIRVWEGIYGERITINKCLTLQGNHSSNTTIDGENIDTVITISASWVNVTGFT